MELKDLEKDIKDLKHVITGNGEPTKGVLFRQVILEDKVNKMDESLSDIDNKLNELKDGQEKLLKYSNGNGKPAHVNNKTYLGFLTPELRSKIWVNIIRYGIIALGADKIINTIPK